MDNLKKTMMETGKTAISADEKQAEKKLSLETTRKSAQTKVSIIVPVYNVEQYLEETMESLINQTLREIEILCYDDCSDDGSSEILDRYAERDMRVKVVHYMENKTAAQSRKDGAIAATGEYIIYVDGDDCLELNACEELAALMDQHRVDMIQFNTTVNCDAEMPESRMKNMQKLLKPYAGRLHGDLVKQCFIEQKFHFQIWNKIFKADLVKRAMAMFPDGRFSKAQDLFAFYLIAYFAHSYLGMPDKYYYVYNFGCGVTGQKTIRRATIDRYADQVLIAKGIRDFLNKMNVLNVYRDSVEKIEQQLLNDSVSQMIHHVMPEDVPYAFDKLCEKWGAATVIGFLADKQMYQVPRWAQQLKDSTLLQNAPRRVKRIGTFYHALRNGGAQRVVAELATLWTKMGYEVVVFTDSEPTNEDYDIPESCKRVVLPEFSLSNSAMRRQRAEVLHNSVKELELDLFITHAWVAPSVFWDMLAVKAADALFYIQTHSVFSMPLLSNAIVNRYFEMPHIYSMADGVMVLSNTDAQYWRYYNNRVFPVINPLTFDLHAVPQNNLEGETIVWVGRLSSEKQPVQAVEILNRVIDRHPNAKLLMVGSGTEAMESAIRRRVEELHLENNVELCGFQIDVEPYYSKGDIFLSTSLYEGFSLTIQEAQCHGMPCIVYAMPYLALLETNKGSFQVPMGDKDAAAEMICKLLDERKLLKSVGADAKENVIEICDIDFVEQWRTIFDSAQETKKEVKMDSAEKTLLQTISAHTQHQIVALSNQVKKKNGIKDVGELRFAPMPQRGPFKVLRRKIHTALRIWVLEGWSSVRTVMREKKQR